MNKQLALRCFIAASEHRNFTAAAAHLGVSISSVTKSIAGLEADLSCRLMNRTTREVALTEVGRAYLARCKRILADLDEADAMARDAAGMPQGNLRVLVPNSFGRVTLIPALEGFRSQYPEIQLELNFGDDMHGLLNQRYDIVVGTADLVDSNLVTRVLVASKLVTVAAPAYLARAGRPLLPEELKGHDCIIGPESGAWRFGDGQKGHVLHPVSGTLVVRNGDCMREAAVCGLGVAQGTWFLFRKDIEAGRLETLLEDHEVESAPVRVVHQGGRYLTRSLRLFLDFLVDITRPRSAENGADDGSA